MKKMPKSVYQMPAELDERIRRREAEAAMLPPSCQQHHLLLREIARLRADAELKRQTEPPGLRSGV